MSEYYQYISRKVNSDLKKALQAYSQEYVHVALDLIEGKAKTLIQAYYDSYNPKVYVRTFNLMKNSIHKNIWQHGGSYVSGEVRVDADDMKNVYTNIFPRDKETGKVLKQWPPSDITWYVFNNAWNEGAHGFVFTHMITPPLPILQNYYDKKEYHKEAHDAAMKAAKKTTGSIFWRD